MMFLNTVLFVVFAVTSAFAQSVYVTIPNGQIKGRQETTYHNTSFYAFQQIPYAKPPIGSLRFMAPQPVDDWDGLLDATVNDKVCYQTGFPTDFIQTEDCLYMNVYTPADPSSNASLPVMFYIFGGGFLGGHAMYQTYGPHLFMDQGVVVVTVNYRTGPFGFMATGDPVVPGNNGLKDQNLALQWVQKNIKYFGGDPTKVTLFGLSAGGASVTFHMLSKLSKGLFRGVISESGSALCPWAYQRNYKDIAYNMAAYLNSSFNRNASSEEQLTFLQSVTADQLVASTNSFPGGLEKDQMVQGFMYTPVVEPEHEGAFLTQRMYDAVSTGGESPVPLMIGIMSEEQLSRAEDLSDFQSLLGQYDQNPAALVNDNMHIVNDTTKADVGVAIRQIYTAGQLQSEVAAGVKFNDVFFYQFSYHGDQETGNTVVIDGCGRVDHAEDNGYLWAFGNNGNIDQWGTARDALMTNRYVQLFTNFAKNLNPTPVVSELFQSLIWPTVSAAKFQYVDIDDVLTIKTDPKGEAYAKWVDLYESNAVKPYDTF